MENNSLTCHMTSEKRLIDANALQFEPDWWGGMNGVICVGRSGGKTMATVQAALKRMIDNAPTVDAVEVVHAYWNDDGRCSNCGCSKPFDCDGYGVESRYCPNCGAKMDL